MFGNVGDGLTGILPSTITSTATYTSTSHQRLQHLSLYYVNASQLLRLATLPKAKVMPDDILPDENCWLSLQAPVFGSTDRP